MAKVNGNGGDEGADVTDAPLIDLNDADIKKLVARAGSQEKGNRRSHR